MNATITKIKGNTIEMQKPNSTAELVIANGIDFHIRHIASIEPRDSSKGL